MRLLARFLIVLLLATASLLSIAQASAVTTSHLELSLEIGHEIGHAGHIHASDYDERHNAGDHFHDAVTLAVPTATLAVDPRTVWKGRTDTSSWGMLPATPQRPPQSIDA